ncbi:unnamed protein product [Linum tenue]|uniref:Transposase n=1 Tax=Linum tenue TaxID=586396 RepID=A0AAV0J4F3_9ROSI|nr:unnamed protein product [Linum tenue]CAI0551660.1 unnamed protein product [Linum tenue]
MLEAAEKYEKAFALYSVSDLNFSADLFLKEDKNGVLIGAPGPTDWANVRRILPFLKKFYEFTMKVSGSLYATSNIFFDEVSSLYRLLMKWEKDEDTGFSEMASRMKKKYETYWGDVEKMNKLLYVAAVLNPMCKFKYVEFALTKIYHENGLGEKLAEQVNKATYEIFEYYRNLLASKMGEDNSNDKGSSGNINVDDDEDDLMAEFRRCNKPKDGSMSSSELDKYLKEEVEDGPIEILSWWKANSVRFPILAHMAKDVLAFPVSTVSSESAFSTGGRVIDAFRSSLTPNLVEVLICTQNWLRTELQPLSFEEDVSDVEKMEAAVQKLKDNTGDGVINLDKDANGNDEQGSGRG